MAHLHGDVLEYAVGQSGQVRITEFMAANATILHDEIRRYPDWIELHNPGSQTPVNLEGWYLANQADGLRKWRFPAVTLPAGGYLVVLASGKDQTRMTISFTLTSVSMRQGIFWPWWNQMAQRSPGNMHRLILRSLEDISYGLDTTLRRRHLLVPTPGAANSTAPMNQGPIVSSASHTPQTPTWTMISS